MQIIQQFNNIDESSKSHKVKPGNIHYVYVSFVNMHLSFVWLQIQIQKYFESYY